MKGGLLIRRSESVGALVLAVAVLVIGAGAAHSQGKYTKEEIIKAWKERQERVKSAKFEWTDKQMITRGHLSFYWKALNPNLKVIVPPKDTNFTSSRAASFDGSKLRYTYMRGHWSKAKNSYEPQSYVSVFDGGTCSLLHGLTSEQSWHQGQIREESFHIECGNLHLQPILMTFRALTPGMRAYDIADFNLASASTKIGGRTCLELSQRLPNGLENRLWIDPARGFVVVRCMAIRQGHVLRKLDVSYKLGTRGEWIPGHWGIIFNKRLFH